MLIEMLVKNKYVKTCFKYEFMKHLGGGNDDSSCNSIITLIFVLDLIDFLINVFTTSSTMIINCK